MSPTIVIKAARRLTVPRFCLAAAMAVLLSACVGNSYMGIPLVSGQADPEVQQLATRARAGDKQAQLELGIRFEEGRGVPADIDRAIGLYRMAAAERGGKRTYFLQGKSGAVQPITINSGFSVSALREAERRLEAIQSNAAGYDWSSIGAIVKAQLPALISKEEFKIFPNQPMECNDLADGKGLGNFLNRNIKGSLIAIPVKRLFFEGDISDIVKLARDGNDNARVALLSLALELRQCSDAMARDKLLDLSDNGFGPASIIAGNLLRLCEDNRAAALRYHLAERQGIFNAYLYYRPLEDIIVPIP